MNQAVVIGAGIGGIAASIRLAVLGYAVTVLEANATFGGKMTQFTLNGYRFDKGPSLFTMPHLVDELFTLAGRNPQDYFRYQRLDIITQYFFADGTCLTAYREPEEFAAEVEKKLKIPKEKVTTYLARSARMYDATAATFLHKSLHQLPTYLSADVLKTIPVLPELGLTTTMHHIHVTHHHLGWYYSLLGSTYTCCLAVLRYNFFSTVLRPITVPIRTKLRPL